jgi:hypothetical protein
VTEGAGKHAGARRAEPVPRARPRGRGKLLALALGTTLCLVAWGYLVWAAIDFGRTARGGDSSSWFYLAIASVGAIACLFAGLLMVVRLLRTLGVLSRDAIVEPTPGGRRARR